MGQKIQQFQYEAIQAFTFGYHPLRKPKLLVNMFYVDGLLIDTGQAWMRSAILKTTSDLRVEQIFVTHHHEDHSANIDALKRQHGCPVYSSSLCAQVMRSPPPISFAQKIVWGGRPASSALIPLDNELTTANYKFQLIPIPGHAEDMVALYEPTKRWLFSADLYVNAYIGYFLQEESIVDQIASIRTILQLDFKVMLCSHNPPTENGQQMLQKKLDYLEDFYQKVITKYQQGYLEDQIMKVLGLNEHGYIHWISGGLLSKRNMVRSAIRDFQQRPPA